MLKEKKFDTDSHMVEITIPVDVYIQYGFWGNINDIMVETCYPYTHVPLMVQRWIEKEVGSTCLEGGAMPYSVQKPITFEVEVFTQVRNDKEIAYRAECHTICPNFVAAWVEQEAMKQYNKERMEVKS